MLKKGDKKVINAWAMYDWANSVYPLVITSAIFPIFYEKTVPENVNFLGGHFNNTELYSYVISASFLVVILLSPILSGIADYSGKKKLFLKVFCYLGSGSCAALYFFNAEVLGLGLLTIFLASVGFWGSLVFYNSFLPEIADVKDHDRISAKGFSLGYIGASILMIGCLALIMIAEVEVRYCFLLVGLWWAGFAQITYRKLPSNVYGHKPEKGGVIAKGFNEIRGVFREFLKTKRLKRYLWSFFIFSMGVQTVMLMAVMFATEEIKCLDENGLEIAMPSEGLIISVLIIQFVAVAGSQLFAFLSSKMGNINALKVATIMWVGICVAGYYIYWDWQFYILAGVVGLVMGGIQALSRSTYAKFLPETQDHASYFSFYDVLEKVGIVVGMMSWGLLLRATGSMRASVLALLVFFAVGCLLLMLVPKNEVSLNNEKS